jgi:hypothetical protein
MIIWLLIFAAAVALAYAAFYLLLRPTESSVASEKVIEFRAGDRRRTG